MIDLETVKEAYLARFGQPERVEQVAVPERELRMSEALTLSGEEIDALGQSIRWAPRCWLLHFRRKDAGADTHVHASFGASYGDTGHELFVTAKVRWFGLERLVRRFFREGPCELAPLRIIPFDVPLTPFGALFVLPVGDGSFPLVTAPPGGSASGSAPHAFRIVPVTPAERRLAEQDPTLLLDRLRAAGAFLADPMRACVVEPGRDQGRRACAGKILRSMRDAMLEVNGTCGPPGAAVYEESFLLDSRATLAHFEASAASIFAERDAPELLSPDEQLARFSAVYAAISARSAAPYGELVPPSVLPLFGTLIALVIHAHPHVEPVVYEAAMGEDLEPPNERGAEVAETRELLRKAVDAIAGTLADVRRGDLLAVGRRALHEAYQTFDRDRGVPWALVAWSALAPALCRAAVPLGPEHGAAPDEALREGCARAAHLPEPGALGKASATERLDWIVTTVAEGFLLGFQRASGGEIRLPHAIVPLSARPPKKVPASDVHAGSEQIRTLLEEMRVQMDANARRQDEQLSAVLQEVRMLAVRVMSLATSLDERLRALDASKPSQ